MDETIEFNLLPDEITFDAFGKVQIRNEQFTAALNALDVGALAEAQCNNSCGDTGCGNSVNGGCSSSSEIYFDDWNQIDDGLVINNTEFSKAILHAKIAGDLVIPMSIRQKL